MATALGPVWEDAWRAAAPALTTIQEDLAHSPSPVSRVIRVGQLDAELLDQELSTLLQEPITKALSLISVRHPQTLWSTEYVVLILVAEYSQIPL